MTAASGLAAKESPVAGLKTKPASLVAMFFLNFIGNAMGTKVTKKREHRAERAYCTCLRSSTTLSSSRLVDQIKLASLALLSKISMKLV